MNNAALLFDYYAKKLGNEINTMMIGKIQSYDSEKNMADIIPLHYIPTQNIEYGLIINVPIAFFNTGGFSIKVQPSAGDIVLVLFCDYDIVNLIIGGEKKQKTDRTHALEDAIALPLSINFLNNAFNSTQDLTISKDNSSTYIKIKSDGSVVVNASSIKLGEGATRGVVTREGENTYTSSKVFAE